MLLVISCCSQSGECRECALAHWNGTPAEISSDFGGAVLPRTMSPRLRTALWMCGDGVLGIVE